MSDWLARKAEREELRHRTVRAIAQLPRFADFPMIRVAGPCERCGGLFWSVIGTDLPPRGRCVACLPPLVMWQRRPDLIQLAKEFACDERS